MSINIVYPIPKSFWWFDKLYLINYIIWFFMIFILNLGIPHFCELNLVNIIFHILKSQNNLSFLSLYVIIYWYHNYWIPNGEYFDSASAWISKRYMGRALTLCFPAMWLRVNYLIFERFLICKVERRISN